MCYFAAKNELKRWSGDDPNGAGATYRVPVLSLRYFLYSIEFFPMGFLRVAKKLSMGFQWVQYGHNGVGRGRGMMFSYLG